MMIYGEMGTNGNDPVSMILRHHMVADGACHASPHYDAIRHGNQEIRQPGGNASLAILLSDGLDGNHVERNVIEKDAPNNVIVITFNDPKPLGFRFGPLSTTNTRHVTWITARGATMVLSNNMLRIGCMLVAIDVGPVNPNRLSHICKKRPLVLTFNSEPTQDAQRMGPACRAVAAKNSILPANNAYQIGNILPKVGDSIGPRILDHGIRRIDPVQTQTGTDLDMYGDSLVRSGGSTRPPHIIFGSRHIYSEQGKLYTDEIRGMGYAQSTRSARSPRCFFFEYRNKRVSISVLN
jgi:hypothetical protein